jgi:hypothetical protein
MQWSAASSHVTPVSLSLYLSISPSLCLDVQAVIERRPWLLESVMMATCDSSSVTGTSSQLALSILAELRQTLERDAGLVPGSLVSGIYAYEAPVAKPKHKKSRNAAAAAAAAAAAGATATATATATASGSDAAPETVRSMRSALG